MKRFTILFMCLSLFISLHAQEKLSKSEIKAQELQELTDLIESGSFFFEANQASPLGMRTINLTSNPNSLKFYSDTVECNMPFFGRAYSSVPGEPGGFSFEEAAELEVEPKKKNRGYHIKTEVKTGTDRYILNLDVHPGGSAMLSITSNNRSNISYNGNVYPLQPKLEEDE